MQAITPLTIHSETLQRQKLGQILYPRQVRSYSCRETRLDSQQKQVFEKAWPVYGVQLQPGQSLNPTEIFSRIAPLVLEIGFGDGASLIEMAKANPEKNFLAIEVYRRGIARLLAGILRNSLQNIRIIFHDAVEVLEKYLPDNSLDTVQIYFADPWPKTRHHKRRLVNELFIKLLCKKLTEHGSIHCATDWENYAKQMMSAFSQEALLSNQAGENLFLPRPTFRPKTKYEKRAEKAGRSIFDLLFIKKVNRK